MNANLQATCASLGYLEGNVYHKEPDCIETIKDLIRFLKRDDETCEIRRSLGETQIVQKDLIPIIKEYRDDNDLLDTLLRLMVNLTQPAKLCFQNQIPEDKTNRNFFMEIEAHLQTYKAAFADERLFAVLTKKLGDLLQLDWENRQEEDRLLIERILILMRNILHVPSNPSSEMRTDDDASINDQVLWSLHTSGMEDLLLYLASSSDETQFAFHILEIISLMLREQTPEQLACAGRGRAVSEKEKDEKELEIMREQERAEKKARFLRLNTRHSRFGGTYTVAKVKSISDREMIYHNAIGKAKDISFDHNKVPKKKAKNRKPITESELTRRSTLSMRLFLQEFCLQFLENCYNPLMKTIKDTLMRAKTQENDETYYLWAMRFFMEFNRKCNFRVDLVSETMSVNSFHYVQINLQNYSEMILSDKKQGIVWSRRIHLALKSYNELLQTLMMMDVSTDKNIRESSKVIKGNVFYMMEYRDIFLTLLKKFDETKQSRTFLGDLVETTHIFIKMLEGFCKRHKHLVVQRKKKRITRKSKAPKKTGTGDEEEATERLQVMWDEVSGHLSAIFQGRMMCPEGVIPFDAASEMEESQQRVEVIYRIQDFLRKNQAGEAVALFRAARELWPDREEFGQANITEEIEFMALHEIFFAKLNRPSVEPIPENDDEDVDPISDEDEEINAPVYESSEQEFNLKEFVMRFASPQVAKAYVLLLKDYKKNTQFTNHCIVKMLHRIGYECDMVGMLFQASLFRIFQKAMFDPVCRTKHFQELLQFAKHIVQKFFEVAKKNDKIFVELFFWKNVRDARELIDGYGSTKDNASRVKLRWTEDQDEELQRLYEQFKDQRDGEMDVVDHIMVHMMDQTKTRRQILKQLCYLGLIESAKEVKKAAKPRGWLEEEELELEHLVDEFRHSDTEDPIASIMKKITSKYTRPTVIKKILQMGLIQDKKELYLTKKRKSHGKKRRSSENIPSDISDTEEISRSPTAQEHPASEGSMSEQSGSDSDVQDDKSSDEPLFILRIRKAAGKCYKKNMEGVVKWIQNCINRTADDREEDDDEEPIPVVPITDEQEDAMKNSAFKTLLRRLGISPPASEQERFWRIPGKYKADDLRIRADALEKPHEEDKSKSNKRKAMLQALIDKKKQQVDQPHDSGESSDHQKPSKRARLAESSDENDSAPAASNAQPTSDSDSDDNISLLRAVSKRKKPVHQSGEDSGGSSDEEPSTGARLVESSDENDSAPAASKAQPSSDSDSDSEDDIPLRHVNKKKKPVDPSDIESAESSDEEPSKHAGRAETHDGKVSSPAASNTQPTSDSGSDSEDNISLRQAVTKKKKPVVQSDLDSDGSSDYEKPSKRARLADTTENIQSFPAAGYTQPVSDSDSDLDDHIALRRAVKSNVIQSDSESE